MRNLILLLYCSPCGSYGQCMLSSQISWRSVSAEMWWFDGSPNDGWPPSSPRVSPPNELVETTSYLILAHWLHYVQTRRHPGNRKYTYLIALPLEKDRAAATKNMVKFGRAVFEICERTDKQTDTLIAILCLPTGDEVMTTATYL